jgi:hypothetical protein
MMYDLRDMSDKRDTTSKQGADEQLELREDELLRTERATELSERALMRRRVMPWGPPRPILPMPLPY